MSFNGTRRFPKNELVSYLQSVGVRLGGDLNASTGYDETIYVLPIPVGNREVLETGLAILREWAGNALLTDADIEAERGVVLAELRSGQAAEERVRRQTLLRMFNGSRYAARLPIGTERSLRTMTPDALRRFYRDWYRPDLQAVIVVGDVNVDEIERSIKALFADVPAPRTRGPGRRASRSRRGRRWTRWSSPIAELPSGRVDITQYLRPQPSLASVGAYDALLEDQLVNRMLGMRLYELTDRPVRPFLAAQAQRIADRAGLRGVCRVCGHCRAGSGRDGTAAGDRDRAGATIRVHQRGARRRQARRDEPVRASGRGRRQVGVRRRSPTSSGVTFSPTSPCRASRGSTSASSSSSRAARWRQSTPTRGWSSRSRQPAVCHGRRAFGGWRHRSGAARAW